MFIIRGWYLLQTAGAGVEGGECYRKTRATEAVRKMLQWLSKEAIRRIAIALLILLAAAFPLVSCSGGAGGETDGPSVPGSDPDPGPGGNEEPAPESEPEEVDYASLGVNELGQIMVLMYHQIGPEEAEWVRTPENFRKDLETLYEAGYRLIAVNDLLDGKIAVPAGTTPVALTFDDGTIGHFRYIEKDGQMVIDPDCAVGILEQFAAEHPDFGLAATFYIMYEATIFGQPEYVQQKLNYLAENGFEIGNHTNSHIYPGLRSLSPEEARQELAEHVRLTKEYVPGYEVRSLALPYGSYPDDLSYIVEGSYNGTSYHHAGVFLVGNNPAPSPFHADYNAALLPRIRASELEEYTAGFGINNWLEYFAEHPEERYISDGDPDTVVVPEALKEQVDGAKLGDRKLITY